MQWVAFFSFGEAASTSRNKGNKLSMGSAEACARKIDFRSCILSEAYIGYGQPGASCIIERKIYEGNILAISVENLRLLAKTCNGILRPC